MPDTNSTALLADYVTELNKLAPQIRGLKIIAADPDITPDKLTVIQEQIVDRQRRVDLINSSTAAINTLITDGYPALPPIVIPPNLLKEIQQEVSDVEAAASIFDAAASISVDLEHSTHVNQPIPRSAPGPGDRAITNERN